MSDSFADPVFEFVYRKSADETNMRALAAEFGAPVFVVREWARGTSRPHPLLQAQVLKFIADSSGGAS